MALATERMQGGMAAVLAIAQGGVGGASFAAAGSVQGDATPITASLAIVTAADGTKGVILPGGSIGDEVTLFNNAGSTCKVYPDVGSAIAVPGTGLGSANAAFSHLTFKVVIYKRVSATQWFPNVSA